MRMDRHAPAGWIAAGHSFRDDELPAPFDALNFSSNNIGASVWVHIASGAMIAAVPTGRWKDRAGFAFYYASPSGTSPISLEGWTSEQELWCGSTPDHQAHHDRAVEYFTAMINRSVLFGGPEVAKSVS